MRLKEFPNAGKSGRLSTLTAVRTLGGLSVGLVMTAMLIASPSVAAPAGAKAGPAGMKSFAELPDWSGMWQATDPMTGSIFDASSVKKGDDETSIRDYPPYKPDWEARYQAFLERVVRKGKYVDPLTLGLPPGFPRFLSTPRAFQFVLRPEQVWMVHERPDVRYIYTDGRPHPDEDDYFPTWGGHSIGHWEGDTLVIDTVGMKGGVTLDRTGLVLSEKAHVIERMRKTSPTTIVDEVTIEDADAFTKPWKLVRSYRKLADKTAYMDDVPSLENNRNPVINGETGTVLNTEIETGQAYSKDVRVLSVP
jgi:hypothetical protein